MPLFMFTAGSTHEYFGAISAKTQDEARELVFKKLAVSPDCPTDWSDRSEFRVSVMREASLDEYLDADLDDDDDEFDSDWEEEPFVVHGDKDWDDYPSAACCHRCCGRKKGKSSCDTKSK